MRKKKKMKGLRKVISNMRKIEKIIDAEGFKGLPIMEGNFKSMRRLQSPYCFRRFAILGENSVYSTKRKK